MALRMPRAICLQCFRERCHPHFGSGQQDARSQL